MSLFYKFGRTLGYAAIPAIRKGKWAWQTLAGNEAAALRAESEFGRSFAAELRLKTGVANDPAKTALGREILRKLVSCVRNKERTFKIDVLLDPMPTAMALPGGYVFVSEGLIDFCQSDSHELAFIIGHEMAHIIRGHALERMLSRIGAEGLSSIVSRGLLNPALRETGLKWLESSHARDAEFEADEFAVRVSSLAGYDSGGALRLLQRVAERRQTPAGVGEYFASHPSEAERLAKIALCQRSLATGAEGK